MSAAAAVPAAAPAAHYKIDARTATPVICPSCGNHFRAAGTDNEPFTLSCAHSLCGECYHGIELAETPTCPVCRKAFTSATPNHTLGEYAEAVYLAMSGEGPSAEFVLDGEGNRVPRPPSPPRAPLSEEEVKERDRLKAEILHYAEICRKGAERFAAAAERAIKEKNRMIRLKDQSIEKLNADTDAFIAALEEHRDKYIAMARAEFERKKALLEPQMEDLKKQAAERAALVAAHKAAAAGAGGDESKAGEFQLPPPKIVPCVPPIVQIVTKLGSLIERIPTMIRVKETIFDAAKSTIEGPGLSRFVAGTSPAAAAANVFTVTCNDSEGNIIPWIEPFDVSVKLGSEPTEATAVVTAPGVLSVSYTVPAGVATAQLGVSISGVPAAGSPFTINA